MNGLTVLVTGAAGGIGRALCETFAAEGARLALVDVQDDTSFAASLGPDHRAWQLDLADPEDADPEVLRDAALAAEDAARAVQGLAGAAGTVIAGVLCLLLSSFPGTRALGVACAVGTGTCPRGATSTYPPTPPSTTAVTTTTVSQYQRGRRSIAAVAIVTAEA